MKNINLLLMLIVMVLSLAACQSGQEKLISDQLQEKDTSISEEIESGLKEEVEMDVSGQEEAEPVFILTDYIEADQYLDMTMIEEGFGDFEGKLYLLGQEYDQVFFMKIRSDEKKTYFKFLVVDRFFEKIYSVGEGSVYDVIDQKGQPQFVLEGSVFKEPHVVLYAGDKVLLLNTDGNMIRSKKIPMTPEEVAKDKDGLFGFMEISGQISDWRMSDDQMSLAYIDDEGGKVYGLLRQDTNLIAQHGDLGQVEIDSLVEQGQYVRFRQSSQGMEDRYYLYNFYGGGTCEGVYEKTEDLEEELSKLASFIHEPPFMRILGISGERILLVLGQSEEEVRLIGIPTFSPLADQALTPITVNMKIITQTIEFAVTSEENLPVSHWSDRLEIRFLGVGDDGLTSALGDIFDSQEIRLDGEDTVVTISLDGLKTYSLDKRAFYRAGYILSQDIDLTFKDIDLDYDLIRWNRDMTETMFLSSGLVDDYLKVELLFNTSVNQADMEAALTRNILYEDDYLQEDISEIPLPDISFEWRDDRDLVMEVTQMESGVYYGITPNGYKDEKGKTYFVWHRSHQSFGGLRDYNEGTYVLQKIEDDSLKLIEYDAVSKRENQVGQIKHYRFNPGNIADQLVHLATSEEYGYYSFVYDMEKDKIYDNDIYISYRNDSFTSKDQLYICSYQAIMRFDRDLESLVDVYKVPDRYEGIYVMSKHPSQDLYVLIVREEGSNQFSILTLDENFDLISEKEINYYTSGFYGMIQEIYWTSDSSICICGGVNDVDTNTEMVSKVYDIYSGEIIKDFPDQIVFSVSPDYRYIIMQDRYRGQVLSVYNQEYDYLYEREFAYIDESASWYGSIALFQYTDIWYDDILYLNLDGENIIRKWLVKDNEVSHIHLPYEKIVFVDVLGEDLFKVFLNMDPIDRSEPFWS